MYKQVYAYRYVPRCCSNALKTIEIRRQRFNTNREYTDTQYYINQYCLALLLIIPPFVQSCTQHIERYKTI